MAAPPRALIKRGNNRGRAGVGVSVRRFAFGLVVLAACSGRSSAPARVEGVADAGGVNTALDVKLAAIEAKLAALDEQRAARDSGTSTPSATPSTEPGCDGHVTVLGPGLTRERWPVDATPAIALEPCVELIRADLALLRLRVVTASRDGAARPTPQWLADLHLLAAINAGMFLDGGRSVGLLVDGDHVDQPRDNPRFGGFLAFGPRAAGVAPVVITGRDCPGFDLAALRARYRSVVQSYRLLGCDGAAIAWADPKAYSAAAIAIDRDGRVVFAHARAPFLMRELSRALASPALGLTAALFVEGGPEATVAVAGDHPLLLLGSYETGFVEDDRNHEAWALPNLIALSRR